MDTLTYIVLAALPPLLSGPVPLLIWVRAARSQNWRWQILVAAVLAILLNGAAWVLMAFNLDGLLPAGFVACGLTPIITLAMVLAWRLARPAPAAGPEAELQRRWLRLGSLAIPAIQLLNVASLVLIAPALCNTLIRTCAG